jgi:hypothetical protein
MVKYTNRKIIDVKDWDKLVSETYGRVYTYQQQDGCKPRCMVILSIPGKSYDDEMNNSVPEVVGMSDKKGVKFDVWLARDPKKTIKGQTLDYHLELFWERNFYPELQAVANDLYKRGMIESGEYGIDIDW